MMTKASPPKSRSVANIAAASADAAPSTVSIEKHGQAFRLIRNCRPFAIKAIVGGNQFDALRTCGRNSVRTTASKDVLGAAHREGPWITWLRLVVVCGVAIASGDALLAQSSPKALDHSSSATIAIEPPVSVNVTYESRDCPELLDENSPKGLRVVQITTDPTVMSHHVYTEAQIFTPDSQRFIFVRGEDYWLCDIADDFGVIQVTDEAGAKGPVITPDGKWMYYVVDRSLAAEGAVTLKRLSLENFTRETVLRLDGLIPGTSFKPSRFYGLSSISSDGKRMCAAAFLGDGRTADAPFGVLVFDLEKPAVKLVFQGTRYSNMHPQYCRSRDPILSHDILIQHDHGNVIGPNGETVPPRKFDMDLHVISDNSTNFRDLPVSRDGLHMVQGHQQWLGQTGSVIIAIHHLGEQAAGRSPIVAGYDPIPEPKWPLHPKPIYLAAPVSTDEKTSHKGINIPGGSFVDVTRNIKNSGFRHFSSDVSGKHLVTDNVRAAEHGGKDLRELFVGTLSTGEHPELKVRYLLETHSVLAGQPSHVHPFFSPDSRMVFFNSDLGTLPQILMVTGYKFPE